jgi:hypothetical protein
MTEPDSRPPEPWEEELEETFDDSPPARSALGILGHLVAGVLIVAAIVAVLIGLAFVAQWIFT